LFSLTRELIRGSITPVNAVNNAIDLGFSQAIAHSSAQSFSFVYSILQSAVLHLESTNPKVAQQARKIQAISNVTDLGWVFLGIAQLGIEIQKKGVLSGPTRGTKNTFVREKHIRCAYIRLYK